MTSSKDIFMQMREQELHSEETEQPRSVVISKALPSILSLDSAAIDTLAKAVVHEVQEGNRDALEALIMAKKGAALFKAIDDNIKGYAYGKSYVSKGETLTQFGTKVQQAELGTEYDYLSSNDSVYVKLLDEFNKAKKAKEEREKFLKGIKDKITVVDEETGEVTTIKAPIKKSTLGYKISIT